MKRILVIIGAIEFAILYPPFWLTYHIVDAYFIRKGIKNGDKSIKERRHKLRWTIRWTMRGILH